MAVTKDQKIEGGGNGKKNREIEMEEMTQARAHVAKRAQRILSFLMKTLHLSSDGGVWKCGDRRDWTSAEITGHNHD